MTSPFQSGPKQTATVWLIEDSDDYRNTVQELIDGQADLSCPETFSSGEALFAALNGRFAPEVILMDIGLPGMSGIEAVQRLKVTSPATHVIMLTIHEDDDRIFQAVCAGASGYLLKIAGPDAVLEAIRDVLKGGAVMTPQIARRVLNMFTQSHAPRWDYQLTPRELDVLSELVKGNTKDEIAKALFVSYHTVDTHVRNIYAKLHVNSRSGAVAKALRERLVRE